MKTQKVEKKVSRKAKDEFYDCDEFPVKSKAKKPKRGHKDISYEEDVNRDDEDDS